MQRIIKFRGKRTDNEQWIHGDLLTFNSTECEISDWSAIDYSRYDVYIGSVGQFTGMHDKNGNEIYEGDILKDSTGRFRYVKFWNGSWRLKYKNTLSNQLINECRHMEIVGNTHDNPELV